MEVTELRIGSWVRHYADWSHRSQKDYKEFYFQLELKDFWAEGECTISLDLLKPILLTEEWLKNFGFQWDGNRFNDTKNDGWKMGIYIIEGKIRWQFDMYNHIKIESVHQFQNLYYALTGRELVLAVAPTCP